MSLHYVVWMFASTYLIHMYDNSHRTNARLAFGLGARKNKQTINNIVNTWCYYYYYSRWPLVVAFGRKTRLDEKTGLPAVHIILYHFKIMYICARLTSSSQTFRAHFYFCDMIAVQHRTQVRTEDDFFRRQINIMRYWLKCVSIIYWSDIGNPAPVIIWCPT